MKKLIIAAALLASTAAFAVQPQDKDLEVITLANGSSAVVNWGAYFTDNCDALIKDAEFVQEKKDIDAMNMVDM